VTDKTSQPKKIAGDRSPAQISNLRLAMMLGMLPQKRLIASMRSAEMRSRWSVIRLFGHYSGTSNGRLLYSVNSTVAFRHSSSKPKCFVTRIVAMKSAVMLPSITFKIAPSE
jgi:hypothetical protein